MNEDMQCSRFFKNLRILVTGGTGTIGAELVNRLLQYEIDRLLVLSKDDSKQYLMKQKYGLKKNLSFVLGDVREYQTLKEATRGMDLVIHTAALKQIPICEENPQEAVKTNIMGTYNLIRASMENGVQKVINISTDKAVFPTNTMGATKFLSEKLIQNFARQDDKRTSLCSVRFGNVLNSRGSVIPLWLEQFRHNQPLFLTDKQMTRFIMTISQAAELIMKSCILCQGGETFIFKMKSVVLGDLATAMKTILSELSNKEAKIVITGPRPGEKKFEELLFEDEANRLFENEQLYVVLPQLSSTSSRAGFKRARPTEYRSDLSPKMNVPEIISLLRPLIREYLGDETNG
ncbi:MAG: SDR family NAD(P)-dependent oxidoreductase [Bacillota bacterium]|nr:SDR family NAD(P)-dependent oxidoreductase [Bacillota bacterium]